MAPQEEYDRWLAESLDEGLALLRRNIAQGPSCAQFVEGKNPWTNSDDFEGTPLASREWDANRLARSEPLALRMLGMFTLLALHAELDLSHAEGARETLAVARSSGAIEHLRAAIEEAGLGNEDTATKHAAAALRRLNAMKRRRILRARLWIRRQNP